MAAGLGAATGSGAFLPVLPFLPFLSVLTVVAIAEALLSFSLAGALQKGIACRTAVPPLDLEGRVGSMGPRGSLIWRWGEVEQCYGDGARWSDDMEMGRGGAMIWRWGEVERAPWRSTCKAYLFLRILSRSAIGPGNEAMDSGTATT